ncbi:hypothetical protein B4125_1466 [Bacillus paralicheniformis]|uniref:Uncharacterized protein n=1 Tax=Bacillus paralicheniformis TaxID=1648923 RepID=A0A7Z0WU64_9BACI|nr:hypothetical protein SC10_B2orf02910 [Bacillus paralicheniformis]OLF87789.1 hypothetical protein B4121_4241 [Bacillus paralicheniformis]OLG07285.1 hypothetical protein B4125_1466 [Bacillus paralicheniformis]TWK48423.1 hypothetical protein CHCC20347_0873 [Bacillus paralicheniformis]TWL40814.1 hypothetical protein CHCC15381_0611 [Bacillus paralicheniformis]
MKHVKGCRPDRQPFPFICAFRRSSFVHHLHPRRFEKALNPETLRP